MKSFDLKNHIFEVCKKHGFPKDIRVLFVLFKKNLQIFNIINNHINNYQNSQNDLLYDLILYTYLKNKKIFFPYFKYAVDDVIFDANIPRLCLNLHSNFSPLTSILINKKYPFAIVSDYPDALRRVAFNSGIRSGNIKIIRRNDACLLNTKKYLEKNYVVSSTIDFKRNIPGKYNLLSDSMLKLALRIRPETFFGINSVNDLGELVYITRDINLDKNLDGIKKDIINFISVHKKNSQFEFDKFDYQKQKNLYQNI